MKATCVWKNSSSNKHTGKSEMPRLCKERGCKGEFHDVKPMCEKFMDSEVRFEEEKGEMK